MCAKPLLHMYDDVTTVVAQVLRSSEAPDGQDRALRSVKRMSGGCRPSSTGGRPGTRRTPWPWATPSRNAAPRFDGSPLRLRLAAGGSGWRQVKIGRNYHLTTDYQHYSGLITVEGVAAGAGASPGRGRGLPMMEVPTPSIQKTSTCLTLPSATPT